MTYEDENATLRAENAAQAKRIAEREAQVKGLVDRLRLDSHTSSKPPLSDATRCRSASARKVTQKAANAQLL